MNSFYDRIDLQTEYVPVVINPTAVKSFRRLLRDVLYERLIPEQQKQK